jgi:hypothetical protein
MEVKAMSADLSAVVSLLLALVILVLVSSRR